MCTINIYEIAFWHWQGMGMGMSLRSQWRCSSRPDRPIRQEGKGEAYATKIDVRCSDRNRIISTKRILIATGGSATAEMAMRYSSFSQWLSRIWMAFMDESQ